ncbi:MAG TPA: DUF998 domain-containing protein, partial [Phenylobacterium sp.]|nr:DUF998 domain-containing protein [Phenylobacterium sp.]
MDLGRDVNDAGHDPVRADLAEPAPLSAGPSARFRRRRLMLACGVAAPLLALASTLAAMAAYPHFNPARQYLSELGGASASLPLIFNAGVFVAGVMAALAGGGFGLAIVALTRARAIGALTVTVFTLAGYGLTQAAIYP